MKEISVKVSGMSCEHCANSVKRALAELGISQVTVDLKTGLVTMSIADQTMEQISNAIYDVGFDVVQE